MTDDPLPGRDLRVGDVLQAAHVSVEQGPMTVFSLLMADSNPIHFDAEYVEETGQGDRTVNQGTLNLAYVYNALIEWLAGVDADLAVVELTARFASSVYRGDQLTVTGRVTAVGEDGSAVIELWLDRGGATRALTAHARVARLPN